MAAIFPSRSTKKLSGSPRNLYCEKTSALRSSTNGNERSSDCQKSCAVSADSCQFTSTTSRPSACFSSYSFWIAGNSCLQGTHHVAQKLTQTTRPRRSDNVNSLPD